MEDTVFDHTHIKARIERIYKSYRKLLCLLAERIVGNKEDAEDIVNDLFLKLWETRDQLHQTKELLVYIYRSVRNSSLKYVEHKQVIREYIHAVSNDPHLCNEQDNAHPLSIIISNESLDEIEQAINTLPSKCKEIFILARMEGLTHQDIAEKLGITINAVNRQITIARNKLRQMLVNELK